MEVALFYDDDMAGQYHTKEKVEKKLRSVMGFVQNHYNERATLKTKIDIKYNTMPITHAQGQSWSRRFG